MAPSANYSCGDCGFRRDFLFDGAPPPVHGFAHNDPGDLGDAPCTGRFERVWAGSAPSISVRGGSSKSRGAL